MKRAASLLELSLTCVLLVAVAGGVLCSAGKPVAVARARRTVNDMAAFLEAGRQYASLQGVWPATWQEIHGVLPRMPENNSWGRAYTFAADTRRLWIETEVPAGTAKADAGRYGFVVQSRGSWDLIRMSIGKDHGQAARLLYQQRNKYAP